MFFNDVIGCVISGAALGAAKGALEGWAGAASLNPLDQKKYDIVNSVRCMALGGALTWGIAGACYAIYKARNPSNSLIGLRTSSDDESDEFTCAKGVVIFLGLVKAFLYLMASTTTLNIISGMTGYGLLRPQDGGLKEQVIASVVGNAEVTGGIYAIYFSYYFFILFCLCCCFARDSINSAVNQTSFFDNHQPDYGATVINADQLNFDEKSEDELSDNAPLNTELSL